MKAIVSFLGIVAGLLALAGIALSVLARKGSSSLDRTPPPPQISQHAEGCPAREEWDKPTKPRVKVCGCCGQRLSHPSLSSPRSTVRKEGATRTGPR